MEPDLAGVRLDVYDTKTGLWTPDHGDVTLPEGWEFLPSGDAFITRAVKAAGVYWLAWLPKTKSRPHRRRIGLWAPTATITAARERAAETAEARQRSRAQSAKQRSRAESRYREELAAAILGYLAFAPEHVDLARRIADDAAGRAAEVGSGRVGRTRKLTVEQRAELAARASIRHQFTDYEDELLDVWDDDYLYRQIKAASHDAVDDFLATHRSPDDDPNNNHEHQ